MSLQDALLSLEGLSVGDAFGEQFFSSGALRWLQNRQLPLGPWRWTDDTHMALSIVTVLAQYGRIEQDALAQSFAKRFMAEPYRGYAGGAVHLLRRVASGADWRDIAPRLFNGGSYGNGGAMRAAPIGGYFAGDPQRASQEAAAAAMVTHAHPEGQAGAMAVAAAAALAANPNYPTGVDFLAEVLPFVPNTETRAGIELAMKIDSNDLTTAIYKLGTGSRVSAQDTVPFCLWSAAHSLPDFAKALWHTVAGFGDIDTTCAIVGGIVVLSSRFVPDDWIAQREPLPTDVTTLT